MNHEPAEEVAPAPEPLLALTLALGTGVLAYPGLETSGMDAGFGSTAHWGEVGVRVWRIRVAAAMEFDFGLPGACSGARPRQCGGREATLKASTGLEFGRATFGLVVGLGATSGGLDFGVSGRWELYTFPRTRLAVIALGEVLGNTPDLDEWALMLRAGWAIEWNPAHVPG